MENGVVIETVDLLKQYGRQTAVDHLSFTVHDGEIFGFLGPNGAGKTTTLLLLLGLTQPTAGSARVCGQDPTRTPRKIKSMVGYLPENVGFYSDLDPVRALEYIADLNGIAPGETSDRILEALRLVGLEKEAHKKVGNFSRGMKQRLGIAEVLIKAPRVLFLDEPTLGLDPDGALRLMELIQSLNRDQGMSVLLSSHNLPQVQKICRRVGIMLNGRMAAQGDIDSLGRESFGVGDQKYSLEEIYMKYFREG